METLHVDIGKHGETTVLTLAGSLTAKHVATLRRVAFQAESESRGSCVLDMTDVDEIDGYGLSALVGMLARRSAQHGRLALYGVSPDLKRRFEATFCDSLFPIRSTLAQALDVLGENP